jgi:hypothetical protein
MMAKLAALEGRVAELEAQPLARAQPARRKPPERQPVAYAALKQERDELAERLARIVAYDPGIEAKAQAWIAEVDALPRRRKRKLNPPANRPA